LTPDRAQRWKVAFLKRAGTDPVRMRTARTSVNSLLRKAKSLFSAKRLRFVGSLGLPVRPRRSSTYRHYRCNKIFKSLFAWLKSKGVSSANPLHTLRKEFGSRINEVHGIYAASRALRHADIAITSQHYLDKKSRATVGLGHLLNCSGEKVPSSPAQPTGPTLDGI
jgi:hypothetical protein